MAKLLCSECGYEFNDNLDACPECGNPASECKPVNQGTPISTNQAPQTNVVHSSVTASTNTSRTDWAHYIYECGVMCWLSFSTKFADFDGRATRREYWSFLLTTFFVSITCPIAVIAMIIPLLAVTARRMHDTNHSGWWMLVPYAGWFLQFKKSDSGVNKYGEPSLDIF